MNTALNKISSNGCEKTSMSPLKQEKINEVRRLIGQQPEKSDMYCSDASISRYLNARNWNTKKAAKMLKATLKWRLEYKPEEIRWEEVSQEAQTGKIYRTDHIDKHGRIVLVLRPGCQNTKSTSGQIRYLVYCMENAILNLPAGQEQMVWLIDFHGFNMSNISVKVTRETAHILQDHYPERLALAILYNPPKFFEPFWTVVKPFLEPKTCSKVKFVYSDDPNTKKTMEDVFNVDELESAFGGFDINKYAERMKEDDKKMPSIWTRANRPAAMEQSPPRSACLVPIASCSDSATSDIEKPVLSREVDDSKVPQDDCFPTNNGFRKVAAC